MKRLTLYFVMLLAVLTAAAPQLVLASGEGQDAVGYCSAVISSLTLPDYTKSTVCESELGRLAADAVRNQTGSDLSVICGGELAGGLRKGDLTEDDIFAVLPGNERVLLLRMTPAQLYQMMEYAVSYSVLGEDETIDEQRSEFAGFPQLSGFEVEYDASQLPGNRVRYIRRADGSLQKDDTETELTMAVSEFLLSEELGYEMLRSAVIRDVEKGTADLLLDYVREQGRVTADSTPRICAVGTADNTLLRQLGILPFLPIVLIIILLVSLPRNRNRLRNMDGSFSKRYRDYGNGNYDP